MKLVGFKLKGIHESLPIAWELAIRQSSQFKKFDILNVFSLRFSNHLDLITSLAASDSHIRVALERVTYGASSNVLVGRFRMSFSRGVSSPSLQNHAIYSSTPSKISQVLNTVCCFNGDPVLRNLNSR